MSEILQQYQRPETAGAQQYSTEEMVQMLVEGAIGKLREAREAFDRGDHSLKGFLIGRTTQIITALRNSLDVTTGDEQVVALDTLYNHIDLCLQAAVEPAYIERLDEALEMLEGMAAAWDYIPVMQEVPQAIEMRV